MDAGREREKTLEKTLMPDGPQARAPGRPPGRLAMVSRHLVENARTCPASGDLGEDLLDPSLAAVAR
jgi:hypothetical protein